MGSHRENEAPQAPKDLPHEDLQGAEARARRLTTAFAALAVLLLLVVFAFNL